MKDKERITVRLTANQMLVLNELKQKLGVNISLLCRTFIGDFLTRNEESLERIISGEVEYKSPFEEIQEDYDNEEIDNV